MILPEAFLDTVSFYEHKVVEHSAFSNGFTSIFTLHFKSAWKWPKKFKMPWSMTHQNGDLYNYREPNEALVLRQQLANYFKETV